MVEVKETEGRQASLLCFSHPAGSPVGHREQREPRLIRGEPRWTEMHTHKHSHTHTLIHTLTQSLTCHMLSHLYHHQAAYNPRALRGKYTGTNTHAHTHTHFNTVTQKGYRYVRTNTTKVFPVFTWR